MNEPRRGYQPVWRRVDALDRTAGGGTHDDKNLAARRRGVEKRAHPGEDGQLDLTVRLARIRSAADAR